MARSRKTIEVKALKDKINYMLSIPTLIQEEKRVLCGLLESILMDTNNYHGFNHIYWSTQGYNEWLEAGKPEDETKNQFIIGNLGEYARSYY